MTPSQRVNETAQMVCCWCGIGFFVLFFLGLMPLMGFIPPPSPSLTANEIVQLYDGNIFLIRFGIIVAILGASLLIPWSVMIAVQVYRTESGRLPFLSILSLSSGLVNVMLFILPFIFWAGAFYRLDRPAELILLINDMSWLEFVMLVPPFVIQTLSIAFAGLTSTAKSEVLPRWFCFFSIWVAILVCPGLVAIFFYQGPFAWNGLIAFWLPVGVFCAYIPCSFFIFRKAIKNHKNDYLEV